MKTLFKYLTIFFAINAIAAPSPFTIPNDTLTMGKTGSADKTLEFNLTKAGASANPRIKYDNASSKLKFSHDGVNYKTFGSGSGGSGGVNLLVDNPDFENGITQNWTDSAGVVTLETSAPLFDLKSFKMTATASGQNYTSTAYAIPTGLKGTPCLGMISYNTTEGTNKYKLQALDGSNNLLAENTLDSTFGVRQQGYVAFNCPTTGSVELRITTTGTAVALTGDNAHLGSDVRLADITQAKLVGTIKITGCAADFSVTNTAYTNFGVQTTCVYTTTGALTAPATMIPGFTVSSLPAGEYVISYEGYWQAISANVDYYLRFTDGTNFSREESIQRNAAASSKIGGVTHSIAYTTTQSNVTFQLQGKSSSGQQNIGGTTSAPGVFKLWYFPSVNETGVRADQQGWHVDASISGANPSLGTSAVTTYTGIENSALTLTNNTGNGVIAAQIPCSTTNPSTGTTCAAGNESVGVAFTVPNAGDVLACASFSNNSDVTSGNNEVTFEIVETPNNAQTISQEGKTRIESNSTIGSGHIINSYPHRVCGNFTFASSGLKTLRLMYEQAVSGTVSASTVLGDASGTNGQRDIHWEVYPLNYLSGAMPIYKGMVTTEASGIVSHKFAHLTATCTTGTCASANNIGISSITFTSTGVYAVNYTNAYSAAPSCNVTATGEAGNVSICRVTTGSTASVGTVNCFTTGTTTAVNASFAISCDGLK